MKMIDKIILALVGIGYNNLTHAEKQIADALIDEKLMAVNAQGSLGRR